VVLISIYGYFIVKSISQARDLELKYYAENFVYLAVIFTAAIILMYVYAFLNSRLIIRHLEKVSDVIRAGENQAGDYFKKLGPIGDKISAMFFDLSRLNESKSLKISALSNLNNFLADNINLVLFILDAAGSITNCSKKALLNLEKEKTAIVGKGVEDVVSGLNFTDLLLELKEKRIPVTRRDLKAANYSGDFVFYPVFNSINRIASIVCILESEKIVEELSKKSEQVRAEKKGFAKRIFDSITKKN
jgi:transcriptional regulator with PAS, ATPase and Fis domain